MKIVYYATIIARSYAHTVGMFVQCCSINVKRTRTVEQNNGIGEKKKHDTMVVAVRIVNNKNVGIIIYIRTNRGLQRCWANGLCVRDATAGRRRHSGMHRTILDRGRPSDLTRDGFFGRKGQVVGRYGSSSTRCAYTTSRIRTSTYVYVIKRGTACVLVTSSSSSSFGIHEQLCTVVLFTASF